MPRHEWHDDASWDDDPLHDAAGHEQDHELREAEFARLFWLELHYGPRHPDTLGRERFGRMQADHIHAVDSGRHLSVVFDVGTSMGRDADGIRGALVTLQPPDDERARGALPETWQLDWPPPHVVRPAHLRALVLRVGPARDGDQLEIGWDPQGMMWGVHNPAEALDGATRDDVQAMEDVVRSVSRTMRGRERRHGDARRKPVARHRAYEVAVLVENQMLGEIAHMRPDAPAGAAQSTIDLIVERVMATNDVLLGAATGIAGHALTTAVQMATLEGVYAANGWVNVRVEVCSGRPVAERAPSAIAADITDLLTYNGTVVLGSDEVDGQPFALAVEALASAAVKGAERLSADIRDLLDDAWFWPYDGACYSVPDDAPFISDETLDRVRAHPEWFALALLPVIVTHSAITGTPEQWWRLDDLCQSAGRLLLAGIAPGQPFQRAWLSEGLEAFAAWSDTDQQWADAAVTLLIERGLLCSADDGRRLALSAAQRKALVHAYRQAEAGARGEADLRERVCTERRAVASVLAVAAQTAVQGDDTRTLKLILPHLRYIEHWSAEQDRVTTRMLLAYLYEHLGQEQDAETWLRQTVAPLADVAVRDADTAVLQVTALDRLAVFALRRHDFQTAYDLASRALKIASAVPEAADIVGSMRLHQRQAAEFMPPAP